MVWIWVQTFFEILILKKGLEAVERRQNNVLKQIYDLVTGIRIEDVGEPNSLVPFYLIKGMN